MNVFSVVGPLKVHRSRESGGRIIADDDINEFWESYGKYANRCGCYVFGRRAGKGYTPGYVGKATKRLKQEIFTADKRNKYQQFLVQRKKGAPIFFFVLAPVHKGKANLSQITKVENHLIQLGKGANPRLLNKQGAKPPNWGIGGVVRGGKGRTREGIPDFRQMMKIE